MVRHGRGDSVVRLGWEFNGTFMLWHASDTKTWIACYRRAADGIRAGSPKALLDWTINTHNTPVSVCGGRSTNCYPGDAYVDVIGIDNYDHHPVSRTKAAFDRTAAERGWSENAVSTASTDAGDLSALMPVLHPTHGGCRGPIIPPNSTLWTRGRPTCSPRRHWRGRSSMCSTAARTCRQWPG
jgi:hypothetical protein